MASVTQTLEDALLSHTIARVESKCNQERLKKVKILYPGEYESMLCNLKQALLSAAKTLRGTTDESRIKNSWKNKEVHAATMEFLNSLAPLL